MSPTFNVNPKGRMEKEIILKIIANKSSLESLVENIYKLVKNRLMDRGDEKKWR